MTSNRGFIQVLIELLFLAVASIVINFFIYSAFTGTFKFPDIKQEGIIPMYVGGIILVGGLHLIFEVTGLNERWCRTIYY